MSETEQSQDSQQLFSLNVLTPANRGYSTHVVQVLVYEIEAKIPTSHLLFGNFNPASYDVMWQNDQMQAETVDPLRVRTLNESYIC